MNKIKIGVIGIGNMGTNHIKSIFSGKVPELEVAAVADWNPKRREWAKEYLPQGFPVFNDGSELIKSGLVQSVLIVVPHYDHPSLTIESFNAGLHVLCEKPAGVYVKQVREMNEAAKKSGLVFGMMFNYRTITAYQKMRELVQSGRLGAIKRVNWMITNWYRTQAYYDSGDWRATWDGEGGGVLLNQCPHNFDLLQWICGVPDRVRAFCHNGKWHDIEVEDDVTAYFEYANGATGTFVTCTADAPGTNRFEICLEKGKLVCEDDKNLTLHELEVSEREFCKTAKGGFERPAVNVSKIDTEGQNEQHVGVMKAFAGSILRGTPLVADGTEGIYGLTISNAMHLSSWLDKTVEIPMDKDLFFSELDKRRKSSKHKTGSGVVFDTAGSDTGVR